MTKALEQQTTARAALKAASKELAKAKLETQSLEESLSRATAMVEEGESALQGFDGLDHETAKWRATAIRKGEDPRVLPAEFVTRIRARADATNELTQATDTRAVIETELEAAKTRLNKLSIGLRRYAAAVLREHANGFAAELTLLKARAWELQILLQGLNSLQIYDPDAPGYYKLVSIGSNPAIQAALAPYSPGEYSFSADPVSDTARRWKVLLDSLVADPNEPIGDVQAVRPSDYLQKTA